MIISCFSNITVSAITWLHDTEKTSISMCPFHGPVMWKFVNDIKAAIRQLLHAGRHEIRLTQSGPKKSTKESTQIVH